MTYNPAMASVKYERSQEALERALAELKKSEKKLRQAIDTIPTLAWSPSAC
jgi:prefoldin subunit 5